MYQMKKRFILIPSLFTLKFCTFFSKSGNGGSKYVSIVLGAFIAGILLTFTPCVLPMVPIVSSIIAGQGEDVTKQRP